MNNINIRLANFEDIPHLLPLMAQLGYPTSSKEFTKRFKIFTKLPGYGVAVACENSNIIGLVAWSKSSLFVSNTTRFHIEAIVLDQQYRGSGVGKKLMQFVEEMAKNSSPSIIDLTSGLRRAKDGSHEFYKKLGYQNEGYMAKLYLRKEIT